MKFFIFLSFLLFSSMIFVSCFDDGQCASLDGAGNCIVYDNCKTDGDCIDGLICNQNTNKCTKNPCSWALNNSASCGLGKCVIGNDYVSYYCQCDEGAGKIDNSGRCLLKCNTYNDCSDFKPDGDRVYPVCSNSVDGGICNLAVCHGENSCPDGKICNETTSRCE